MSVETTMHVHETTINLINDTCMMTGMKRNSMIILLFKHAMMNQGRAIKTGCGVRYQDRDIRKKWHTVHVYLREDEADYLKDLRNFFKLSVSYILALAAIDYLEVIVSKAKMGQKTDNYRFSNYLISRKYTNGLIQWRIYWGIPRKTLKTSRK